MKTAQDKLNKLSSELKESNRRLADCKTAEGKTFFTAEIRFLSNKIEFMKSQVEFSKLADYEKSIKKQARDEKKKINLLARIAKMEGRLRKVYDEQLGVKIEISTVQTNHNPAVPIKS